jgi:hypothetical protein
MNLKQKKTALSNKISNSLEDYYFDVQSMGSPSAIDESQLVKLVTKLAVGAATVWWTAIELKDYIKLRKDHSKFEESINDFLSRENP